MANHMSSIEFEQFTADENVSISVCCQNLRVDISAEQALFDATLIERVINLALNQPDIQSIEVRICVD